MTGLLMPIRLGPAECRNRVLFGPHETNLGRARAVSPRQVAYYRRRAVGGCGIVVTETASVHESDWPYERAPLAADCAEGWAAVAAACHGEGALALASLGHAGMQGSSAYSQLPLWGPSAVPEPASREVPKVMEPEDIAAVVAGFAAATALAVDAGLDGVEVNAGQHSLIRQFLSGLTNLRSDEYGTDRGRFAREVLAGVREAAGAAVVGLRLCCDEMAPWAGIVPEAGATLAAELAGWLDYVVVVRGSIFTTWATRPDGHTPPGFNLDACRAVRQAVPSGTAVVAQGSLVDVGMAESVLADGVADLVEMTRAQIADPELVGKLAAGTAERIRPCILCNQACQVRDARNPIVSCVGAPASGHETEEPAVPRRALHPREVLVVGAGPAGLEAARISALAGHRVRVVERSARPGGRLRVAAAGAGRERLALLADWLAAECGRLGVDVEVGREVGADELVAHGGPVILCTGSRSGQPTYEIAEDADVRTAEQLLLAAAGQPAGREAGLPAGLPAGRVAIWDPIGGPIALSVAELLAPHGEVVFLTPDMIVGNELGRTGDLSNAGTRLLQAGVEVVRRAVLRRVRAGVVEAVDKFTGEEREFKAVVLVDCGYRLPEDTLWRHNPVLPRAGDAVAPRSILEAVLEGRRAGLALGGAR